MAECAVGRHLSTSRDYSQIPDRAASLGMTAFQIFAGNPRSWSLRRPPVRQLRAAGARCEELGLQCAIHTSYLINLCRPLDHPVGAKSVALLRRDLHNTADWGDSCLGAVVHMGRLADMDLEPEVARRQYAARIRECLEETEGRLLLETGAGVRGEVGTGVEDLGHIWRLLEGYHDRVGFCIDTAHIWAAGYDIATAAAVRRYLRLWQREIGTEHIRLIHFNDSGRELDSHVDCHADLGYGLIGLEGLGALAQWARRHRVPLVAETPGGLPPTAEVELMQSLCAG